LGQGGRLVDIDIDSKTETPHLLIKNYVQLSRPDVQYLELVNESLNSSKLPLVPMLQKLVKEVEDGLIKPLPMEVFEMRGRINEAFKRLRTGENVGKIVLRVHPRLSDRYGGGNTGTVVITGGLGGLGIIASEVLVLAGFKTIVLVSRSGTFKHTDQGLAARLEKVRLSGTKLIVECCDMSIESEVAALLERVRDNHGPLRIVIHAAGILSDALLENQDDDSIQSVFAPKADGAWYLHKHTLHDKLEHFIMFSSLSALFGNIGQLNYATANSSLDMLAQHRRTHGLPAISIQWPGVSEVGMAAALSGKVHLDERMMIGPQAVADVLEMILGKRQQSELPATISIIPRGILDSPLPNYVIEGGVLSSIFNSSSQPRRRPLRPQSLSRGTNDSLPTSSSFVSEDVAGRRLRIPDIVLEEISFFVGTESLNVDMDSPLMELGMDSLGVTQFIRVLSRKLDFQMPQTILFDYPTARGLSNYLVSVIGGVPLIDGVDEDIGQQERPSRNMPESHDIAIVGMSCKFPGGIEGPAAFWEVIASGRSTVGKVPFDRWDTDAMVETDHTLDDDVKKRIQYGGFVHGLEFFDNAFFKISPSEAKAMDPQQRLLLEYAFLAFIDAGYDKLRLVGRNVGVFVGVSGRDTSSIEMLSSGAGIYGANNFDSAASGRISYIFGNNMFNI
jgi:NAD(P)-dependent dehydrogenase (short-subunit alcohol dehydrogenase family)/acyl carrier protein